VHLHVLKTESLLKINQVDRGAALSVDLGIDEEGRLEVVHVTLLVGLLHGRPGLFGRHLAKARWEDVHAGLRAGGLAMACVVRRATEKVRHTLFAAAAADLVRALAGPVAVAVAGAALAAEHDRLRAVGLVVAGLAAVEAVAGLRRLGAVSRAVAGITAAAMSVTSI
jgi:hypothetical protein